MKKPDLLQARLKRIAWVTIGGLLVTLFVLQWFAVPEGQRPLLDALLLITGLFLVAVMFVAPLRHWSPDWVVSGTGFAAIAIITALDLPLASLDLSPGYVIVIVLCAIASTRTTTLIIAVTAGLARALVVASSEPDVTMAVLQIAVHLAVYLVAGYLVSLVSMRITERWSAQAAESERQRKNIAERRDELEGLFEISQMFASVEDEKETFRQVTERIAHLLGAEICGIARLEGPRTVRGVPPAFGLEDDLVTGFEYPVTPELTQIWDIAQHESIILNDLSRLPPGISDIVSKMNVSHAVAARMMIQNRPFGMIFVASRSGGRAFEKKDARLLGILASQAAVALENARLYATAQENLQNVTRLYGISSHLVARSDPDTIPQKIVAGVAEAVNAPNASMALLNEETGILEYAANLNIPDSALTERFRENGIAMTVMRTGEPRFFEDILIAADINPITREWGFRATACLPIWHRDKPLGVLYVNYSQPHSFTQVEKSMLAIFANQAAIALENARLHRVELRKAKELEALANISRSLAETMHIGEMYQAIEREVRIALPKADAGALLMLDPACGMLIPRASFGFDREILSQIELDPSEGIAGQVFQNSRSVHLIGLQPAEEIRRSMEPQNQALLAAASTNRLYAQSVIAAAVPPGSEKLGAIVLLNYQSERAFSQDDLILLEGIADRIALAIRNAQLYEQGVRRAAQLSTVAKVAHSVSGILDMNTLLPTVAQLIHDQFGYRYVHVFMNDNSSSMATFRAGAGPAAEAMQEERVAVKFGMGMVGWVAETGQVLLANDVRKEPRFLDHPLLPETCAELALPLKAGMHMIGVLDVQSERRNVFESTDIAALETLAGQIATAIENAALYGDLREQARRDSLTQVYNHGYFVQRLNEEVEKGASAREPVSLIMLDIDYFKEYNDQYGHVIGDQVLGATVQAISRHVHRTDVVGRWGGEEFGIALLRTSPQEALTVANRIRETLIRTRLYDRAGDLIVPPTVSQGIATFPRDACDTASLIDQADSALYRAKSRGRDQICTSEK